MTRCDHVEAKLDPIVRAETCYRIGEQHIAELGVHLLLVNCKACHSTLAVPLPGHVEEDDWDNDATKPGVETPPCPVRDDVSARAGFVAARSAA